MKKREEEKLRMWVSHLVSLSDDGRPCRVGWGWVSRLVPMSSVLWWWRAMVLINLQPSDSNQMLCVELLISNKCDPLVRLLGCLAAGRILLVFYEGGSGL